MEKLADEFQNLTRTALLVRPRQPFVDWANSLGSIRLTIDQVQEGEIYLLPDYETVEEMEKWLRKNFDEIFCEQLFNWHMDESAWVKNRTFQLFGQWFQYSLHTMIWDTVPGAIKKI